MNLNGMQNKTTKKNIAELVKRCEIKLISYNSMTNSINGKCVYRGKESFFKIVSLEEGIAELRGYQLLKSTLDCQRLYDFSFSKDMRTMVLFYDYDPNIGLNRGLFVDALNNRNEYKFFQNRFVQDYREIINMVYLAIPEDALFSGRFGRINHWYTESNLFDVSIFKKTISLFRKVKESQEFLYNIYLRHYEKETCIISHGDINELNITQKGVFCDFSYSGVNSYYSEFVVGFCSIAFQNYFDMKYHPSSYKNHMDSIQKNHTQFHIAYTIQGNRLIIEYFNVIVSELRRKFLQEYIALFKEKISNFQRVKEMLLFRLMTVRNIAEFDERDRSIILALCASITAAQSFEHLMGIVEGKNTVTFFEGV